MNELIIELLANKERPQLTDQDVKDLMRDGFVFGSYVYGDSSTAADFDIAVYYDQFSAIDPLIGDKLIYEPGIYSESPHFDCFYGVYNGKIINVLRFLDKPMFNKYFTVTEIMKSLRKSGRLNQKLNAKDTRVQLFEYFLNFID